MHRKSENPVKQNAPKLTLLNLIELKEAKSPKLSKID